MTTYKSTSGKQSGVTAYEINENSILVEFRGGTKYLYSNSSAGKSAVEEMKQLALNSNGLSTYIAQNKPDYETKY
jgi:predicted lipoprotein with Yx(FWY)xxD motif